MSALSQIEATDGPIARREAVHLIFRAQ